MCFKSSEGIFSVAQLTTLGNFVKLHRAAVKGWNVKPEKEMEQFQKVKIDKISSTLYLFPLVQK